MLKQGVVLLLLLLGGCEGAIPLQRQPELVSPLGRAHFAQDDTAGSIEVADSVLRERPADIEALLAAAGARAAVWHYHEAIAIYDSTVVLHPTDWRPWRFRGHRHISLRQFDAAVQDLEKARQLDSLSFDVAYHLGLARYLKGDWASAADEYARCMRQADSPDAPAVSASLPTGFRACTNVGVVDNDRVAITEWRWRALRRAGRTDEAKQLLDAIDADMDVGTNASYHALLLLHKGERPVEQVFDTTVVGEQFETIGYGVAVQWLTEGDTTRALDLMRRIVTRGERWQSFGFIAAESDLIRLGAEGN
jgi:tetratricopeptide (TPR) repeat protein